MVLYIQNISGNRKHYVINSFADLENLMEDFPVVREIALFADSIEDAVESTAEYLSGHSMDSWVESNEKITKSMKAALTSLGMAAAAAMLPATAGVGATNINQKAVYQQEVAQFKPFGQAKEDKFLHNIMQLESGGGKYTDHQTVKHGPLRNEKAIGKWGMMPSTVDEILDRQQKMKTIHPMTRPLIGMDRDQRNMFFKQKPYIELELARHLARHVLHRHGGDIYRAAYSWNHGHNLLPHEISDEDLQSNSYVKDFTDLAHGKPVRGLSPMAMVKVPGQKIHKHEQDFSKRLKKWKQHRENEERKNPLIVSGNWNDPGRQREPELDRKPSEGKTGKLIDAIRIANKKP